MSIKFWRTILFTAVLMLLLPLSVFAGIYAHDPMENPKAAQDIIVAGVVKPTSFESLVNSEG